MSSAAHLHGSCKGEATGMAVAAKMCIIDKRMELFQAAQ